MEPANPYQPSEIPVEPETFTGRLPTSSYVSAGCSAVFVFVGGMLVLVFVLGFLVIPVWLIFTGAVLGALILGAVSAWETLQLERRKRRRHLESAERAERHNVSPGRDTL